MESHRAWRVNEVEEMRVGDLRAVVGEKSVFEIKISKDIEDGKLEWVAIGGMVAKVVRWQLLHVRRVAIRVLAVASSKNLAKEDLLAYVIGKSRGGVGFRFILIQKFMT